MKLPKIFAFIIFLTNTTIFATDFIAQQEVPKPLADKLNGFKHKLDPYKNIAITIKDLSPDVMVKLETIIKAIGDFFKNKGLFVTIPLEKGAFTGDLEKLGFKFWSSDVQDKTLTYLYANGRDIPYLDYAYTAAAVFLLRNNPENGEKEILIINEPAKSIANIVGGISDRGESPEDTVVREVWEEIGLKVTKEKLRLVAIAHNVRPNKRSSVEFVYVCEDFEPQLWIR